MNIYCPVEGLLKFKRDNLTVSISTRPFHR